MMEDSTKEELLQAILTNNQQTDVKLVTVDSVVWSHQCLLASLSSQLGILFSERACCSCDSASCGSVTEVVVLLGDFQGSLVEKMLQYIYTGQCIVDSEEEMAEMVRLKECLGLDIELEVPHGEREETVMSPSRDSEVFEGTGEDKVVNDLSEQKNLTRQMIESINELNEGAVGVVCVSCGEVVGRNTLTDHYRDHMESLVGGTAEIRDRKGGGTTIVAGTEAVSDTSLSPTGPTLVCSRCSQEVSVADFAQHFNDHNDRRRGIKRTAVENFGDFLKKRHSSQLIKDIKTEPVETPEDQKDKTCLLEGDDMISSDDVELEETAEVETVNEEVKDNESAVVSPVKRKTGIPVNLRTYDYSRLEPVNEEDIDMDEYEMLLRSHIRKCLRDRNRKSGNENNEITEQEIDVDILRNPRNVKTEYPRLRFRRAFRILQSRSNTWKRKGKLSHENILITEEDVKAEIVREKIERLKSLVHAYAEENTETEL